MTSAVPILNLPNMYADNGQITYVSTTSLSVAAGQFRDSTNTYDIVTPAAAINAANNGLNGLDTGSLGASKQYAVLAISDPVSGNTAGYMLSLSATSPTLPFGYGAFRVVGYWFTDSSSHLLAGYVAGNGKLRQHYWDTAISALSGGTATTLTGVSLAGAVVGIDNTPVLLEVSYTPATANDKVSIAPYGSTATVLPNIVGSVAAKVNSGQLKVMSKLNSTAPTILYINSASSGSATILVCGFEYFI